MAPNATFIAAVAAACLVLLTCAHAASQGGAEGGLPSLRQIAYAHEAETAGSGRCAVHHARFGGRRAQLIRVTKGSVQNYVVLEVGKRDPSMRSLRTNWLKASYGVAEHVWLGEYGSADTALARAVSLCPAAQRCWPGEADCGPQAQSQTAARLFFGRWAPAVAPGL
jgi:hypothetical protein